MASLASIHSFIYPSCNSLESKALAAAKACGGPALLWVQFQEKSLQLSPHRSRALLPLLHEHGFIPEQCLERANPALCSWKTSPALPRSLFPGGVMDPGRMSGSCWENHPKEVKYMGFFRAAALP